MNDYVTNAEGFFIPGSNLPDRVWPTPDGKVYYEKCGSKLKINGMYFDTREDREIWWWLCSELNGGNDYAVNIWGFGQ